MATLGLTPMLLLTLHAAAVLPLAWEHRPLDVIQTSTGFAYASHLQTKWMSTHRTGDPPVQLLENGVPLIHANKPVDEIASYGLGRFTLSDGYLYFSASDNSDPRSNGRRYELVWPMHPPSWLRDVVVAMAIAVVGWLVLTHRHPPFWLAAALFLGLTAASRLWFFLDTPVPGIYGDSTSYYALVRSMNAGEWPLFTIRTPGYPLFLKVVFSLSNTLMAVIVAQHTLMVAASLTLILAFHRVRPWLSPWAALGMTVFSCGLWPFEHDSAVVSDSAYSSMIIFALAFVVLAVVDGRLRYFLLASTAMATVILIRPAGAFLLVVYALCLAFFAVNRLDRPRLLAFAIPLPVILLALCIYNARTFHTFTLTAFGESQIAFATFTFWEQDPAYPPSVNDAVRRTQEVMRDRVNEPQRQLLHSSWDYRQLAPIFLSGFHYPALAQASTIDGRNNYLFARQWIRRISLDAIARHPDLYLKFVLTQLWLQYFFNVTYQEDFLMFVKNRILEVYGTEKYAPGKADAFAIELAKEYAIPPQSGRFHLVKNETNLTAVVAENSASRRWFKFMLPVRRDIFANVYWVWGYFAALILSVLRLAFSKASHAGAFITFIVTISLFGASLVVALFEYGGHRYSYVMEYVYYLPLIVLPFLRISLPWMKPTSRSGSYQPASTI